MKIPEVNLDKCVSGVSELVGWNQLLNLFCPVIGGKTFYKLFVVSWQRATRINTIILTRLVPVYFIQIRILQILKQSAFN